jgi:hypothetical protein
MGLIIGKVTRGFIRRVIMDFLRIMVGMVGVGVGSSWALPLGSPFGSPVKGTLKGSYGGVTMAPEALDGCSGGDDAGNAPGPDALDASELIKRLQLRVHEAGPLLVTELAWDCFQDESWVVNNYSRKLSVGLIDIIGPGMESNMVG